MAAVRVAETLEQSKLRRSQIRQHVAYICADETLKQLQTRRSATAQQIRDGRMNGDKLSKLEMQLGALMKLLNKQISVGLAMLLTCEPDVIETHIILHVFQ